LDEGVTWGEVLTHGFGGHALLGELGGHLCVGGDGLLKGRHVGLFVFEEQLYFVFEEALLVFGVFLHLFADLFKAFIDSEIFLLIVVEVEFVDEHFEGVENGLYLQQRLGDVIVVVREGFQ
jgi:hypothetical protein